MSLDFALAWRACQVYVKPVSSPCQVLERFSRKEGEKNRGFCCNPQTGMQEETYDVLGIGHALVDASFSVSEAFLTEQGLTKGQMTLCDHARLDALRAALPEASSLSAGGSCSNTLALLGGLGARLRACYAFVGRVGFDAHGESFRRSMEQSRIECMLEVAEEEAGKKEAGKKEDERRESTGQCLVLVTEDAQRTFATHLGASSDIVAARLDRSLLRRSRYLYLEGYLLGGEQGREVFKTVAAYRQASSVLSLSLSDPSCVSANRDFLLSFVHSDVDLLFANEEEGRMLFSLSHLSSPSALREALAGCCSALGCRVCLTLGAEGALLFDGEGGVSVSAALPPPRCVDTTGAGDAFAAGMLFGLSQGWSQERAGALANGLGGAVTSEVGPRLTAALQPFLDAVEKMS